MIENKKVLPIGEDDFRDIRQRNKYYVDKTLMIKDFIHMLMLGMVMQLRDIYDITSNIESGHGRNDIKLKSKCTSRPHIILEFKQGEDVAKLKYEALKQIDEKKYFAGLKGHVLCVGIALNKKKCELIHETITL